VFGGRIFWNASERFTVSGRISAWQRRAINVAALRDEARRVDSGFTLASLSAKIDAGADFFQTQYCFDMDILRDYMKRIGDFGILERTYFIIGIGPITSAKSGHWMNKNLFGVHIPESLINRLEQAEDGKAEGQRICIELLQ